MDTFSSEKRSEIMKRVKSSNTSVEIRLRKELWRNGLRGWRISPKGVPGKPDLVFREKKVAIFVDGCFWHGCPMCNRSPKSNTYWDNKISRNMVRDKKYGEFLTSDGWLVIRLWEHEVTRDLAGCISKILSGIHSGERSQ